MGSGKELVLREQNQVRRTRDMRESGMLKLSAANLAERFKNYQRLAREVLVESGEEIDQL